MEQQYSTDPLSRPELDAIRDARTVVEVIDAAIPWLQQVAADDPEADEMRQAVAELRTHVLRDAYAVASCSNDRNAAHSRLAVSTPILWISILDLVDTTDATRDQRHAVRVLLLRLLQTDDPEAPAVQEAVTDPRLGSIARELVKVGRIARTAGAPTADHSRLRRPRPRAPRKRRSHRRRASATRAGPDDEPEPPSRRLPLHGNDGDRGPQPGLGVVRSLGGRQ